MANTIDELMERIEEISNMDPLQMRKDKEIAALVAYQRKQRELWESGVKPKKESGPKPALSLSDLMNKRSPEKPAEPKIIRRL